MFRRGRYRMLWVAMVAAGALAIGAGVAYAVRSPGHETHLLQVKSAGLRRLVVRTRHGQSREWHAPGATTQGPPPDNGQILPCYPTEGICGSGIPIPFSSVTFVATTQYTSQSSADLVTVWGGASGADPGRGGMMVMFINPTDGSTATGSGVFYPSADLGPLTIVGVEGSVVSFTASSGGGTFDYNTDLFDASSPPPTSGSTTS